MCHEAWLPGSNRLPCVALTTDQVNVFTEEPFTPQMVFSCNNKKNRCCLAVLFHQGQSSNCWMMRSHISRFQNRVAISNSGAGANLIVMGLRGHAKVIKFYLQQSWHKHLWPARWYSGRNNDTSKLLPLCRWCAKRGFFLLTEIGTAM